MTEGSDISEAVFDWREFGSPSIGVSNAVAEFTGRSIRELDPLHQAIDSDALDTLLVENDRESLDGVRLSFVWQDLQIWVEESGRVELAWVDPDE